MIDLDGAFGIRWRDWGRLAALSWVSMFLLCWVALPLMWRGGNAGNWMCAAGLLVVLLGNVLPGVGALTCRPVRQRLRELPEAAALSLVCVSAGFGFASTVALSLLLTGWAGLGVLAMVMGTVAFPMTFGAVFPLAIPLACALKLWKDTRRNGTVSRLRLAALWVIAAFGWLGVGLAGLLLAHA